MNIIYLNKISHLLCVIALTLEMNARTQNWPTDHTSGHCAQCVQYEK